MNPVVEFFRAHIGKEAKEVGSVVPIVVRWLNVRVLEANVGHVIISVLVRPDMCNPAHVLHGGLQCTIMDEAIGIAVGTLGVDNFHVNTNFAVDFLDKAPVGSVVIAEARVVRAGKNLKNVQCELRLEQGGIIARGTSNLLRTGIAPLAEHTGG
jgi:acyl-coenzyme A thioesterase 13